MKIFATFGLTALILILLTPGSVFAFRCGSKLISIGNTKADVMAKCGQPNWRESWEEERVERVYGTPYSPSGSFPGVRVPIATIVHITIDEWTYNFGPSYFIRILRFENNRLKDIQTGDYGY